MQLHNRTSAAFLSAARLFQQPLSLFSSNQTSSSTTMTRAPVIAVCHGGGPMPLLGDPGHANLIESMSTKVPETLQLGTPNAPKAIVLVTAHWTTRTPKISSAKTHELYYDYGGFPPESYRLRYDAPGSPEVAKQVFDLLQAAGFTPSMDEERGWDHGVFVPLTLINPKADIPVVQISVLNTEESSAHYAMGRALAPLRDQGIAIIGSGMPTFHNLRLMFSLPGRSQGDKAKVLDRIALWSKDLTDAVCLESSEKREAKLKTWRGFKSGDEAHPPGMAEHLLPLFVCAGAGGDGKAHAHGDDLHGSEHFTYSWK
ncbi:hypothetical protein HYALB_00002726 [Hymenoscyphus albidus]|uniref:Extradiol ring-cleavage dioxygenase class III enzyme subunit B domain-containing protein n=1 Tax=Hymenoscyphus albidus TaxID=595503 RepID=A0A9N9M370_9HELO|nr:hypothetical protein HYALB_00002726 [Hymenoscyphus albidus]